MAGEGTTFEYAPSGPFDLFNQNQYFGGWPTLDGDRAAIVMAFSVEGGQGSAAVVLKQSPDGELTGQIHGPARLRHGDSCNRPDPAWLPCGRR